jgi:hypothetical protein
VRCGAPSELGAARRRGSASHRRLRRARRQVQLDPEHAADADRAFHADGAAHQFDQPLVTTRPMPVPSSAPASWPSRLNGWNSCASCSGGSPRRCRDADAMRPGVWRTHVDRAARLVVLDRVGQQVDQDLLDPGPVGLDEAGVSKRGKVTPMPRFCACGSIMAWHSSMTSASDTGSSDSDSLPDSISARSRISLISSSRYQPALRIWSMLRFCEGVGGGVPGFHQLGEAEDRVERRAQLVAHAGEEIRFREVGLLGANLAAMALFSSASTCLRTVLSVPISR